MKYNLFLDENNYLKGFEKSYSDNGYELKPTEMKLDYLNCYKLVGDEAVFDEEKYNTLVDTKTKEDEIARLKQELADTDYEAIKYSEGWFTDDEYAPIKAMREDLRKQIRKLESE